MASEWVTNKLLWVFYYYNSYSSVFVTLEKFTVFFSSSCPGTTSEMTLQVLQFHDIITIIIIIILLYNDKQ